MLSISDLNQIIKFYAFRIQQRIEELEHLACYSCTEQLDQQQYEFIAVISKYNGYVTKEEREVKLARKLNERVIQIFQFFKGKSNNQNLLGIIQSKMEREMASLLATPPIRLGELFSYIHLITKRGCVIRPPAEKKRILSRSILKDNNKVEEKVVPAFSLVHIMKRPALTVASNKHLKAATPLQRMKVEDVIHGIYSGLELDKLHLLRIKDSNENILLKDALRRNEKITAVMRKYDRRRNRRTTVTEMSQECKERGTAILSEVKINIAKGGWGTKKRRPALASRKKHNSIKENVSILV